MSHIAFLLTAVIWANDGLIDNTMVFPFVSKSDCQVAGEAFAAAEKDEMESRAYAFKGSYHWDCRRVWNDSEKVRS